VVPRLKGTGTSVGQKASRLGSPKKGGYMILKERGAWATVCEHTDRGTASQRKLYDPKFKGEG